MYVFKDRTMVSELFNRVVNILNTTPLSRQDDVNHRIR